MATAVQRAPVRLEQSSPVTRRESTPTAPPATDRPERLMSLDAYRGFIMIAMASSGLGFIKVAQTFPDNRVWSFLGYEFDHAAWVGCSFWDLIQPSFMFMVGVAMPYSLAGRQARNESRLRQTVHVLYRAVLLTMLGVFLSSNGTNQTDYTFVNVLSQIGLGYAFVYLLLGRGWKVQVGVLVAILVGYWLLFALWPVSEFNLEQLSVEAAAKEPAPFEGFLGHWNKNANTASAFDDWFLNLFPQGKHFDFNGFFTLFSQGKRFDFNRGGYQTLNFIPSMATMIFGLMAGEWLRTQRKLYEKFFGLFAAGLALLVIGAILGVTVCPLVKRIWTPSWAVFSTGWTLVMLAGFFWIIDVRGWRRWSLPLIVVGMNSIAMYLMSQLMRGWVRETFKTHLGQSIFGGDYGGIWERLAILAVFWLICLWMYRQKIFVRI